MPQKPTPPQTSYPGSTLIGAGIRPPLSLLERIQSLMYPRPAPASSPEMHAPGPAAMQQNLPMGQAEIGPPSAIQRAAGAVSESAPGRLLGSLAGAQGRVQGSVQNILDMKLPGLPVTVGDAGNLIQAAEGVKIAPTLFHASRFGNIEKPLAGEALRNTGVGDQWQGSGLYLAEHPGVTRYYQGIFGGSPHLVRYDPQGVGHHIDILHEVGQAIDRTMTADQAPDLAQHTLMRLIEANNGNLSAIQNHIKEQQRWHAGVMDGIQRDYRRHTDLKPEFIEDLLGSNLQFIRAQDQYRMYTGMQDAMEDLIRQNPGAMMESGPGVYQAFIPAQAVNQMMHLDKPIQFQPKQVRENVLDVAKAMWDKYGPSRLFQGRTAGTIRQTPFNIPYMYSPRPWEMIGAGRYPSGWDIQNTLSHDLVMSPQEVSDVMSRAGVPGNRYLDKRSRQVLEDHIHKMLGSTATDEEIVKVVHAFYKRGQSPVPMTENIVVFDPAKTIQRWEQVPRHEISNEPVLPQQPLKKWPGKK